MTPEAEKIHKAWLARGFDFHDRFGLLDAAAEVVRQEVAAERKRCVARCRKRAEGLREHGDGLADAMRAHSIDDCIMDIESGQ